MIDVMVGYVVVMVVATFVVVMVGAVSETRARRHPSPDPLDPMQPWTMPSPWRDRTEFVDKVARPLIETDNPAEERRLMVEFRKANPYYLSVALLMATDAETRAEQLAAERGRTIERLQERLGAKNRKMDALHYVWCDGGCPNGVNRYTDGTVTQEIVDEAIRNTARLTTWWENHQARLGRVPDA